jgi:hypothetical protein
MITMQGYVVGCGPRCNQLRVGSPFIYSILYHYFVLRKIQRSRIIIIL